MGLKIGIIAAKTGVPASTIRYYVNQGLLPEPDRVNKSMSYYDESCIEKIKAIRHLQESKFYPLSVIKNIIRRMDEGLSLQEAEAIDNLIFGTGDELVDIKEYLKQTGLTAQQLHEAENLGIIMPLIHENERKLYDKDDIHFGRDVLKRSLDLNLDIKDFEFYISFGKDMLEYEAKVRKKIVKGMTREQNIQATIELTKFAGFIRNYIFNRLFQRKIQERIERSLKKEESKSRQ